ncbi:MAG TPA: ferritin-like domain-containing protein [Solirubrobacteraceae bacterium]|nr:ferritin-like domain-containing protein [Solirubrobacteraceae bacterium]
MTRRRVLAAGALLAPGAGILLAGCGRTSSPGEGAPVSRTDVGTQVQGDIEVLNSVLDLEHTAVAAYVRGGSSRRTAAVLEQEREHVARLERAVRDLGGRPAAARPPADYDFPPLAAAAAALAYAERLELTVVAAYLDALPKLAKPELRALAAELVAQDAAHLAVVRGGLGRPQAPDAFVVGEKAA